MDSQGLDISGDHEIGKPPPGTRILMTTSNMVFYTSSGEAGRFSGPNLVLSNRGVMKIGGLSGTATEAKNLRGAVTVSDMNTSALASFGTSEPDGNYYLTLTPTSVSGTPAAGANRIASIDKVTTGFTVHIEAAPGAGNSITFDWHLIR